MLVELKESTVYEKMLLDSYMVPMVAVTDEDKKVKDNIKIMLSRTPRTKAALKTSERKTMFSFYIAPTRKKLELDYINFQFLYDKEYLKRPNTTISEDKFYIEEISSFYDFQEALAFVAGIKYMSGILNEDCKGYYFDDLVIKQREDVFRFVKVFEIKNPKIKESYNCTVPLTYYQPFTRGMEYAFDCFEGFYYGKNSN